MFTTVSESIAVFDAYLNETHDTVTLLGVYYFPSELLKSADPVAYRCGWLDWCDAMGIDTDQLEDDYTFRM